MDLRRDELIKSYRSPQVICILQVRLLHEQSRKNEIQKTNSSKTSTKKQRKTIRLYS